MPSNKKLAFVDGWGSGFQIWWLSDSDCQKYAVTIGEHGPILFLAASIEDCHAWIGESDEYQTWLQDNFPVVEEYRGWKIRRMRTVFMGIKGGCVGLICDSQTTDYAASVEEVRVFIDRIENGTEVSKPNYSFVAIVLLGIISVAYISVAYYLWKKR